MINPLWKEFDELGEEKVRQNLVMAYGENKSKSAREWLAYNQSLKSSILEERKISLILEQARIARIAKNTAITALIMLIIFNTINLLSK